MQRTFGGHEMIAAGTEQDAAAGRHLHRLRMHYPQAPPPPASPVSSQQTETRRPRGARCTVGHLAQAGKAFLGRFGKRRRVAHHKVEALVLPHQVRQHVFHIRLDKPTHVTKHPPPRQRRAGNYGSGWAGRTYEHCAAKPLVVALRAASSIASGDASTPSTDAAPACAA